MSRKRDDTPVGDGSSEDWERLIADGEAGDPSVGFFRLVDRFLDWYEAGGGPKKGPGLDPERLRTLASWTLADVYAIRRDERHVALASPVLFLAQCKESMGWAVRCHDDITRIEGWLERRTASGGELTIDQEFLDMIREHAGSLTRTGTRVAASDVAASANRGLASYMGRSSLPRRPTHLLRFQLRLVRLSFLRQLRRIPPDTFDHADLELIPQSDDDSVPGYLTVLADVVESLCSLYASGDQIRGLSDGEAVAFLDRHVEPAPRRAQEQTARLLGVVDRTVRTYLIKARRKVDAELQRRGWPGGIPAGGEQEP